MGFLSARELWDQTLVLLEDKLSRPSYEIISKRIKIKDDNVKVNGVLTVESYGNLSMDCLMDHLTEIESILLDITGNPVKLNPISIDLLPDALDEPEPIPAEKEHKLVIPQEKPAKKLRSSLNELYTFENFVHGNTNRLCYSAARAVASAPGKSYNPLFIYGGVGLGKTHIMQAIGHYVLDTRPNLTVEYITTNAFYHEMMNYIQEQRLVDFSKQYLKSDVLMIDDIQFLEKKERTQHEFFQIFNTFYENKKQIIITCDRLPKEIPTLEDRLVSRLHMGLIVDIIPPDYETRLVILRRKISALHFSEHYDVPEEVLECVAQNIRTNIRDLEGTLNRILAHARFTDQEITVELAEKIMQDISPRKGSSDITATNIIREVAKYYQLEDADIIGKRRKKEIVLPRMAAMYLTRIMTKMSLQSIGKEFGNKDHTSVLYSCEKIEREMAIDPKLKKVIETLRDKISG